MDALLESPLLETVRHGRPDEVDRVLGGVVGAECTLAGLGVSLGTES